METNIDRNSGWSNPMFLNTPASCLDFEQAIVVEVKEGGREGCEMSVRKGPVRGRSGFEGELGVTERQADVI
ncbi:hypothetical protein E2C01_082510 [Portunus trituberculatus]|uniref:Uncharacterized protein n=1 Tax=Portunus trituberculatus TaxID=210409 RepID=A0A5B7IZB7_PORTR|nr:hypothetical protein [Portunus trituberculatus]